MFGKSRRRQWITKENKSVSIRRETENNPGSGVSVDQLHSSQPGLVPQLSGKLTSARIWASQVMVDHFSDLNYVHTITGTRQEDTLSGKLAIERWATAFRVKIKRYNADNRIFFEQPFR